MRLPDRVQLIARVDAAPVGDPIRAHVGSGGSGGVQSYGGRHGAGIGRFVTAEIVVMLAPGSGYDHQIHDVMWRGERWTPDGAPAYVRRHGRDHHVSVPLKRVTTV